MAVTKKFKGKVKLTRRFRGIGGFEMREIWKPNLSVAGSHASRKLVDRVNQGSMPRYRPPVRAGIRVLGMKNMIGTGTCRLRLVGIDSRGLSSSNFISDLLTG